MNRSAILPRRETLNKSGWIDAFSEECGWKGGGTGRSRWLGGGELFRRPVPGKSTRFHEWMADSHIKRPSAGCLCNTDDSNQRMDNYAAFRATQIQNFDQLKAEGGVARTQADSNGRTIDPYIRELPRSEWNHPKTLWRDAAVMGNRHYASGRVSCATDRCAPPAYEIGRLKTHRTAQRVVAGGPRLAGHRLRLGLRGTFSRGYKAGGPDSSGKLPTAVAGQSGESEPTTKPLKAQFLWSSMLCERSPPFTTNTRQEVTSRIIDPIFGVLTALVNIPK